MFVQGCEEPLEFRQEDFSRSVPGTMTIDLAVIPDKMTLADNWF
jgi:hypothetical protein